MLHVLTDVFGLMDLCTVYNFINRNNFLSSLVFFALIGKSNFNFIFDDDGFGFGIRYFMSMM